MGFSRQEYWSGLPFPAPGDLPDPGITPRSPASPALAGRLCHHWATWETLSTASVCVKVPQLCLTLRPHDCSPPGSSIHGDSPGKNTRVGYHALLQEIFPTQGTESGSPALQVDSLPSEPPGTLINKIPNYLCLIPASQICFPLQILRPTQQQSEILDSKTKSSSPETWPLPAFMSTRRNEIEFRRDIPDLGRSKARGT